MSFKDFEFQGKEVSNQAVKYECSYCGGYRIIHAKHHLHTPFFAESAGSSDDFSDVLYTAFHIEDDQGNSRKICSRCLIKMFDKLIPKQKKQKKVSRTRFLRPSK
jgi:DNA-directed RNA polymerase subunit RPC12/RpoP